MVRIIDVCAYLLVACIAVSTLAGEKSGNSSLAGTSSVSLQAAKHLSMTIKTRGKTFVSGMGISVQVTFHNHGKRTVWLSGLVPGREVFGPHMAYDGNSGKPVANTWFGHTGLFGGSQALGLIRPGQSGRFWRKVDVGEWDDVTVPGRYRIQFHVGHTISDAVSITVKRPARAKQGDALVPVNAAKAKRLKWGSTGPIQLAAVVTTSKKNHVLTGLPALTVYVRNNSKQVQTIQLTGDPLIDFRDSQVVGPDGYNGDKKFAKPKPHWGPIPRWKAVPLTAYGKQLKEKAAKNRQVQKYSLTPGQMYRYTVMVDLRCRFDMSWPGKYHARAKLAGTDVASRWEDVRGGA